MLERITDDIAKAIVDALKIKDFKFEQEHCLLANKVLYEFLSSYAWDLEFKGVELRVSSENPLYSEIHIPEFRDPDVDDLDRNESIIRYAKKINVFGHLYEYPEYWDDDQEMPEPYKKGSMKDYSLASFVREGKVEQVIKNLSSSSEYYKKVFEKESSEIQKNINKLHDIEYVRIKDDESDKLIELCHLDKYSYSPIKSVFGHRYFSGSDKYRNYICAKNWLGVVGIVSLFDHNPKDGFISEKSPYFDTLSYISVSPSYRNEGISKEMFKMTLDWTLEKGKILRNTDYTYLGRKFIQPIFGKIAQEHCPQMTFVEEGDRVLLSRITKHEGFSELSVAARYKIVKSVFEKTESLINESNEYEMQDYLYSDTFKEELDKGFKRFEKNQNLNNERGMEPK